MSSSGVILQDKFIVDGVQHDDLPDKWMILRGQDGFGVRRVSSPVLSGGRVVTVAKPPATNPLGFDDRRVDISRAYEASWGQNTCIMGQCLYTQLEALYATQRPFWLQYDDEMSRDSIIIDTAINLGTYRAFATTNFPIFPLGYIPTDTVDWTNCVFVNGVPISTDSFVVNQMLGTVTFTTQLQPTDIVNVFYTWRAYVQVTDTKLYVAGLAGDIYAGTVMFETITVPPGAPAPWNINMPCQTPVVFKLSDTPTVLASNAVNPTEEGWTYGVSVPNTTYASTPTSSAPSNPLIENPSNLSAPSVLSAPSMCLATDTPIELACGTKMLIGALRAGDYVNGPDGRKQEITNIQFIKQPCVRVTYGAGWFICSESHELMIRVRNKGKNGGRTKRSVKQILPGMKLVTENLEADGRIKNIEPCGERLVAKITCAPDHMFYADGVLHHNKGASF